MPDQQKYINKLKDARILIIGGTSGIGFALAEACLESGAYVTVSSSNPSRVKSTIASLKGSYSSIGNDYIRGVQCDLSNPETLEKDIERLFNETVNGYGSKLDHVVFTAGDALALIPLKDLSYERILQAAQIRFFAPLLIAKFIPTFLHSSYKSSYTITTGSISEKPMPNWSVVASFAGGHHSMVRNLALDLKPIRVNGVSPGVVDTELWRMSDEEKKGFMETLGSKMPTGRPGQPEDVAESFLAVMRDGNMDGSVVRTDGGGMLV